MTLVEFEMRLCFHCKAPLPHGRELDSLCDDCFDDADSYEFAAALEERAESAQKGSGGSK